MAKKKYKIDYDQKVDCFEKISHIKTELIYGDLSYITNPFISYIIPVYKRPDLLEKTLNSVLNQRKVDFAWDIVVVDNEVGEENDTEKLIRKIKNARILYYRNCVNIGVDGNYNRCIEIARGKWVAMLHADDLIMDDHLEEMSRLIKEYENKKNKRPLAYICQRYMEFSDESKIILSREKALNYELNSDVDYEVGFKLSQVFSNGKLEYRPQSFGLIIGYYGAVPSFGTIINRKIIMEEGGFNADLGICEDIITPYKLANKYGVYMAPKYMGFYRFSNNESIKTETILKIYASMTDFREYMYSKNILTMLWGSVSRDILNKNLRNYCIGLSRFGNQGKLKNSDFDDKYQIKEVVGIQQLIFDIVVEIFNKIHKLDGYKTIINRLVYAKKGLLGKAVGDGFEFVIYGAGHVAEVIIPALRNEYRGIAIKYCAVSDQSDAKGKLFNIPIRYINDLMGLKDDVMVITATEIWQYQDEMNETLKQLGFQNIINLLGKAR